MKKSFSLLLAGLITFELCSVCNTTAYAEGYPTGSIPSDENIVNEHRIDVTNGYPVPYTPTEYSVYDVKQMLENAIDSQENYNTDYDLNQDGKVSFSDAGLLWHYEDTVGGQPNYVGKNAGSEFTVLNVKKENTELIVTVEFLYTKRPSSGRDGGFDCAISYNKENLKFEKLEWADDFLKTYPVDSNGTMSDNILVYKDMEDYVAMTGLYYNYREYYAPVTNLATLTFSILNDTENITQNIDLTLNATNYKQDIDQIKANTLKYYMGGFENDFLKPPTLYDTSQMLEWALGIFDFSPSTPDNVNLYDLDNDGDLTLKDTCIMLKQALGIEKPIIYRWD